MYFKYRINQLKRYLRSKSKVRASWDKFNFSELKESNLEGKKILIATSTGSNWPCSSFDSLLACALKIRGCNVSFLLCDGILPACQECDSQWISSKDIIRNDINRVCKDCFNPAHTMLKPLGIKIHKYSDFISNDKLNSILSSDADGYDESALAGALRFFGIGHLNDISHKEVYSQYLKASNITKEVIGNLIKHESPNIGIVHHGIYIPQGIICDEMNKNNIKTYVWGPSYRKGTVLFCKEKTYHHTMISENNSSWENYNFTKHCETQLMNYLSNKNTGANDWISFQSGIKQSKSEIYDKFKLDPKKTVIGLLTNVIWDAQLHFKNSSFSSMMDWLFFTIEHFKKTKDTQLLIRIHPAEVMGTVPSNQKVYDEIIARYNSIPSNIKIIMPNDKTSTYSAMDICDSILVYGTKTAIELSALGKRVIIAGESWARGKGFTIDVSSAEEYQKILKKINKVQKLDDDLIMRARKYAFHLFFRRMIPVKSLKPLNQYGPYQVSINDLSEIKTGYDKGLDTICSAIINDKEFIYDE